MPVELADREKPCRLATPVERHEGCKYRSREEWREDIGTAKTSPLAPTPKDTAGAPAGAEEVYT